MATTGHDEEISTLLAGLLLAVGLASTDSATSAEQAHPFGAIGWESGALTTEILRLIVERGYGYTTDTLPGSTVSMEVALARNDLQVIAEEWAGRSLPGSRPNRPARCSHWAIR
jgi:glycine betaine/proline transport system substrate-binding protein